MTEDEIAASPWDAILAALTYAAKGEAVPSDVEDAAWQAGGLLGAASLVSAGCSVEQVERLFVDRDWSVRFTYDRATDQVGIDIQWADGSETAVEKPATIS